MCYKAMTGASSHKLCPHLKYMRAFNHNMRCLELRLPVQPDFDTLTAMHLYPQNFCHITGTSMQRAPRPRPSVP